MVELIRVDITNSAHIRFKWDNLGWPDIHGPRDVSIIMEENSMDMSSKKYSLYAPQQMYLPSVGTLKQMPCTSGCIKQQGMC